MSQTLHATSTSATVLALRKEFDLAFAQAPRNATANEENLLAIRLGNDSYALRIAEIGGLHADWDITPLPTQAPELLGVAGFRGRIAPVYDLAALLGHVRQASPRWLVLVNPREPVALAFENFESHFSVPPEQIVKAASISSMEQEANRPHLYDAVRTGDAMRPIIDLSSLLENIRRRHGPPVRPGSAQS